MTRWRIGVVLAVALLVVQGMAISFGAEAGVGKAYASPNPHLPALMITEVTPDSKKVDGSSGTPDAFEFIELYNNTSSPINLKNYVILYKTPTVNKWVITEDKFIPAQGTFVVWASSVDSATLADFNRNYGTSLDPSQVFRTPVAGMANSSSREISIAGPNEVPISTVSYVAADVAENIGIPYLAPIDGSSVMRKSSSTALATPGSLIPGQIPADPPYLMVTEVTPDTLKVDGSPGTPDAFEFIELYNNTNSAINLRDYQIIYKTPTVYTWTITEDKYIPAHGTFVIWVSSVSSATIADFNLNYGTSLTASQIFIVSASGLANADSRTISVADPNGAPISTVSYGAADVAENIGIPYLYPTDGSVIMRKSSSTSLATPGAIGADQVPTQDVPEGLEATPGTNQVTLTWHASGNPDVAFYRIYKDDALYTTVASSALTASVTGLATDQPYTFQITSVLASGYESAKSPALKAAPLSIQLTQTSVVSPPSGSFPEYASWMDKASAGPYIPGLAQGLVPQGIAYVASEDWYLVSHYRNDGKPSMLSVLDASSGQLVKQMSIYQSGEVPHTGHVGGVTVSESHVWLSSDGYLYRIPLQEVVDATDQSHVYIAGRFATGTRSSYAMYADGILWSGEFYASGYATDPSHVMTARDGKTHGAWVAGFALDETTDRLPAGRKVDDNTAVIPDYILSVPNNVQGAAVSDERIVLTQSFGRANDSTVASYANVLSESPHTHVTVKGTQVPLWYLDGNSLASQLTALPMAEGIVERDQRFQVLFESAASSFLSGRKYATDRIWSLDTMPKLMITEVTPDTLKADGTPGTPDAFEFIELYNNTNSSINLKNYAIIYETPTVYKWVISENKSIPAHGTFVVWVSSVSSATLADFNQNYGTSLTASQVFRVSASGLANAASRTLSIAGPGDVRISTVQYGAADVAENIGIPYLYPTDGSIHMRKSVSTNLATPGSLLPGQAP